jgi:hypothetical protein
MAIGEAVDECPPGLSCPAPHPDTAISATASPLLPDIGAGTMWSPPPAQTDRLHVTGFAWVGGAPTSEWVPDSDRVRIEGPNGVYARDSIDTQTLLYYEKRDGLHIWGASWDVPRDAPTGTYRFHILGHRRTEAGGFEPYELYSPRFEVGIGYLSATWSGNVASVRYVVPDALANFHFRGIPERGSVLANVDGTCVSAPIIDGVATFAGTVNGVYDATDQFGNRLFYRPDTCP